MVLRVFGPGGSYQVPYVQIADRRYHVARGTAFSELFYMVKTSRWRSPRWVWPAYYASPEDYFDAAHTPSQDRLADLDDAAVAALRQNRVDFLASDGVRRWRTRCAEIRAAPEAHLSACRARVARARAWPRPCAARD